jgi:predicted DNA-binding transcriptional regulator AlpA
MTKLADHLSYPPRLMRLERAAAYLAMSTTTFLRLVDEGVLPQPARIHSIVAWDRLALDAACDSMAAAGDDQNTVHAILRGKV